MRLLKLGIVFRAACLLFAGMFSAVIDNEIVYEHQFMQSVSMTNKGINHPDIVVEVFDECVSWLKDAFIKEVAFGFRFTEGAAWHPGQFFLFSDTPANKIYRFRPQGIIDVFLANSGLTTKTSDSLSDQIGSNGLAIDSFGNNIICQHGNHAIAKLDYRQHLSVIVDQYNGRPFNSPNDLVVHSNGDIFFTDPPYGLKDQVLHPETFQPVAGIYRYSKDNCQLIGKEHQYPNGLFFSEDERFLFVSSNFSKDKGVLRYKINSDNHYSYESVWITQAADGMCLGKDGFVYLATDRGIKVVCSEGKELALITLPQTPSNCCWGGIANDQLLITARSSIYMLSKKGNDGG